MIIRIFAFVFATLFVQGAAVDPLKDWPSWRGPTGDGIAAAGQNPPTQWSETENVLWKTPVPGRGHSSPTVVGGHVYMATSDTARGSQSILCFDRQNGKLVWQTEVHKQGAESGKHAHANPAASTVACDGENFTSIF